MDKEDYEEPQEWIEEDFCPRCNTELKFESTIGTDAVYTKRCPNEYCNFECFDFVPGLY